MKGGFAGKFYIYHLDDDQTLLVDPDEDISPNFEHFKRDRKNFSEQMFRGLHTIILKKNEELIPVPIKNTAEFYEGLYFLNRKTEV